MRPHSKNSPEKAGPSICLSRYQGKALNSNPSITKKKKKTIKNEN
jgi:hypothetical protein